jgi:hypothetical protein
MTSSSVKKLIRPLFLLGGLAVCMPFSVYAQNIAISHCQGSCPAYSSGLAAKRANIVVHNLYAAGLDGDSGRVDWVAYRLTKAAIGVASLLPRFWQADDLLRLSATAEMAEQKAPVFSRTEITSADNSYGGFDVPADDAEERARLAPMTSFAKTPYWPELNKLSNMVPMPAPLRRGAWLQLEQTLNRIVVEDIVVDDIVADDIVVEANVVADAGAENIGAENNGAKENVIGVISGPLYLINQTVRPASNSANLMPAAYFKVVVVDSGIAAFVFSKDLSQSGRFCEQQADLEQIERMSNLDLFPNREPVISKTLLQALGCSNS